MDELSDEAKAVLDFEAHWWKFAGRKDADIRDRFDCSPTVYYRQLGAILDDPAAMAYDVLTVKRLRRMRESRRAARSARRAEG